MNEQDARPRHVIEVRLHGRGGQGGVTCAKILAAVWARLGKSVQTFGDYAGERAGAPIRAYTRASDEPITDRNKVYRPDHVLVLDATLLGPESVTGLAAGGTLLINATVAPEEIAARHPGFRVATVDATAIARRHGIGTRSVVIVNTTIAGAFVRAMDLPLDVLEATYRSLGFASNLPAAKEAYDQVRIAEAAAAAPPAPTNGRAPPSRLADVLPLVEHREGPPPPTHTGNWRTQAPHYVRRLAPCNAVCPAGTDVVAFLHAAAQGDEAASAAVLGRTNPFAAVCGRICPAPCEDNCNRREHDGAVRVRAVERSVADRVPVAAPRPAVCKQPRRIAIVGGGPAGLSAAYTLQRLGHRATVYEGQPELGGHLRSEVPASLLPREVLDREIDGILRLGVEVRAGRFVAADDVAELARTFEAVIVATGLAADAVPPVAGRAADLACLPQGWTLRGDRVFRGDEATTVFAAGDVVTGERSVARAVGEGRRVALSALASIGVAVSVPQAPDRSKAVRPEDIRFSHFARAEPEAEPLLPTPERLAGFEEVCGDLDDAAEAKRCLSCGKCTQCDTCLVYCPEGVIHRRANGYVVDTADCKGCGICVGVCPRCAMEMSS